MLPEIREAMFNEDESALTELLSVADQADLNAAMFGCVLITNNPDMLATLLDAGADINYQDKFGRTALYLAVKYGRKAAVELLLDRKCDIQRSKFNGSTVLHLAAKKGSVETMEMLVNAGHSVNCKNWGGNTPLLIACRFGQKAVVNLLLKAGATLDEPNSLGHTALHYACVQGSGELVASLLRCGACGDPRTHLGISPLMLVCEWNSCHLVRTLGDKASLHRRERLYGGAVIHWVVASGCVACTKHLIGCGASIYHTDTSGRNALIQAIQSNKPAVLTLLLDLYRDSDFKSVGVNTMALHVACYLGRRECVEVLCTHYKSRHLTELEDVFGSTPLDIALQQEHKEVVLYLLQVRVQGDTPRGDKTDCLTTATVTKTDLSPVADCVTSDREVNECNTGGSGVTDLTNPQSSRLLYKPDSPSGVTSLTNPQPLRPLYKTYSPIKLALLRMLRSVEGEQVMVADKKFDFNDWLEQGPEAFVLKVVSMDMTDWVYTTTHNPWPLRELCRGAIRLALGYRACDKVERLPLPRSVREYLRMEELEGVDGKEIKIRNTESYQDVDIE